MKIYISIKDILMYMYIGILMYTYQFRWEENLFNCYQIKDCGNLRLRSEDRRSLLNILKCKRATAS